MPVYFFTFHAYRSWMPDHERGYTKRGQGRLPRDEELAREYAARAKYDESRFLRCMQRILIDEAQRTCRLQGYRLHGAGTEVSHAHFLISWQSGRDWLRVRIGLKTSLSRRLAREFADDDGKVRLSRGGSAKHVRNRKHFDYLMRQYLPDHSGLKWFEDRGYVE